MLTTYLNGHSFGDAASDATILNHALVPFRAHAVYLRLTTTMSQALDYAAGGFHVSVDRGLAGGALDPWEIHQGGTKAVTPSQPRHNAAATSLWAAAATRYKEAYDAGKAGGAVAAVKEILAAANLLANTAYADESKAAVAAGLPAITPPHDPLTKAPESGAAFSARGPKILLGVGAGIAAFGLAAFLIGKRKKHAGRAAAKRVYGHRRTVVLPTGARHLNVDF